MRLCYKEWAALKEICRKENLTRNKLIEIIEQNKPSDLGLSYSTRLFISSYYQEAATEFGHKMAKHGLNDNHSAIIQNIKNLFNS